MKESRINPAAARTERGDPHRDPAPPPDLVDGQTLTTGQTEEDLRLHGWAGERVLDDSDKPDTQAVPDPSRRRTGTPVNPER